VAGDGAEPERGTLQFSAQGGAELRPYRSGRSIRGRLPGTGRARSAAGRVLVALAVAVACAWAGAGTAHAAPAKPPTDWSFYISTSSTAAAYNLGCNQGNFDRNQGNVNSEVLLDFGGQNSANTGTIRISDGAFMSYGTIASVAEQFAYGYWVCTGSDTSSTLFLNLGTNNSAYSVNSAGGASWANTVNTVRDYVNAHWGQVVVQGGNDIEPSWASYSSTLDWASGFGTHTSQLYLNYGSADGCPQYSYGNGGCNNGWNQYDVWWLAWGYSPAITAPEIYYSANARQWHMISMYGAVYQGRAAHYIAPWDEYDLDTSTLTSDGAWSALWNEMNSTSQTASTSTYSMEIHWQ
jgi:hypothetical protein